MSTTDPIDAAAAERGAAALRDLAAAVGAVAARVAPAVVGVRRGWGGASGVVVAPGKVVTNAHALRGSEPTVVFADGRRAQAAVAAVDPDGDLAVLDVDTGTIEHAAWADSAPGLGAAVVALANPGGRGLRATLGFISSGGRTFRGPRGRRLQGALEHTAPLPRGSSGGPLVDLDGLIVGLNTLRLEGGLVLALGDLRDRVDALARGEAPRRPRLGLALAPAHVARRLRRAVGLPERDGLLVRGVSEGGPGERAGIERGDLLVAVSGRDLHRVDDLLTALEEAPAGPVELTVVRGIEERTVPVEPEAA
jgi:serine protease Do